MKIQTKNVSCLKLFFPFFFLFLYGTACRRSVATLDKEEKNNPYVQSALRKEQEGDIDGAIISYQNALERQPSLAVAHFALAQMLHDYKKDYIKAIYHYNRYLELRPETEKKQMIKDRIQQASQMFAAGFFKGDIPSAEKVVALEKENLELKEQISTLREEIKQLKERTNKNRKTGTVSSSKNGQMTRTYKVEKGDTLITIAEDLYGDKNKWQLIYEANKGQINETMALKEGQILNIP